MDFSFDPATDFVLLAPAGGFVAKGRAGAPAEGGIEGIAGRVDTYFRSRRDGPRLIAGALPFDRDAAAFLFQPASVSKIETARGVSRPASTHRGAAWSVAARPSAAAYGEAVAKCLALFGGPGETLRKVVLSRSLLFTADRAVDPAAIAAHLARDPSVATFSTPLPSAGTPRTLVGATPELLVRKSGAQVVSHPLAGSARRSGDPAADRRAAASLEASDKDRREHRAVIEAVFDTLSLYCAELSAPEGTTLRATASMWHLGTRIEGILKDPATPAIELAAALHPTPAVCGLPRLPAATVIRELEGYDRGFYAGAVGWADESGDGAWYVAIRCAEVIGNGIRLYAGAGIVPGSEPALEIDETSAKFAALLGALGIDEQGRLLRGQAA